MEIIIRTPREFSFKRTVISHGWCELLPFRMDRENWTLYRTLDFKDAKPVTVTIQGRKQSLVVKSSRSLSQSATKNVSADVRHMMRLDDNIEDFYSLVASDKDFDWIPAQGAGRLLRSP